MNLIQKLLIILTIFIASYIVFNLLNERQFLLNLQSKKENFALFGTTQSSELSSIQSQLSNLSITDTNADDNRTLKEYVIKASYNSAVSGDKVSTDMVNLVLSRGCRFLDFEILIIDGQPCVTYTKDSDYLVREPENYIILDTILSTVSSSAFSKPTPNTSDPLFLHLRVKSKDKDAFIKVASSIESTLAKTNKLYTSYKSSKQVVQHQKENKLNVAMQNSKFAINSQLRDFIMNAPNYINYHADLSTKNNIADDLIKLISDHTNATQNESSFNNAFQKYKRKYDILNRYDDNHFSGLSGKYYDTNTHTFTSKPGNINNLVPDTDIVNFFAFNPSFTDSDIRNYVIPSLNVNNRIDSLFNVKLKDIKGKIVIVLDNSNISNFNELTKCNSNTNNCYNINNYVFSLTNSNLFQKYKFSELIDSNANSNKPKFINGISNTQKISIAVPDTFSASNISNPDIRDLIFNFGIQIPCFKYYAIDNNLLLQEKLFNTHKSAIVPLENIMNTLNKCDEHNELYKCYEYE